MSASGVSATVFQFSEHASGSPHLNSFSVWRLKWLVCELRSGSLILVEKKEKEKERRVEDAGEAEAEYQVDFDYISCGFSLNWG